MLAQTVLLDANSMCMLCYNHNALFDCSGILNYNFWAALSSSTAKTQQENASASRCDDSSPGRLGQLVSSRCTLSATAVEAAQRTPCTFAFCDGSCFVFDPGCLADIATYETQV